VLKGAVSKKGGGAGENWQTVAVYFDTFSQHFLFVFLIVSATAAAAVVPF